MTDVPASAEVIDLMAALEKSVADAKAARYRPEPPQIVITNALGGLYMGSESFYPDISEAIASIGDEFHYRVCEERELETPDADDVRWMLAGWVHEQSDTLEMDPALSMMDRCAPQVEALCAAMLGDKERVWYPAGEVLHYIPESETP